MTMMETEGPPIPASELEKELLADTYQVEADPPILVF